MGAAASLKLKIPAWQHSSKHTNYEYANEATRANLKEKLLGNEYARNITQAGDLNKEVKDGFLSLIGTQDYFDDEDERYIDDDKNAHGIHSRRLAVELVVGMGSRLRNKNIYNFFTVVLSIIFLYYAAPLVIWGILQQMRLIHSKKWTKKLAAELGAEISVWPEEADTAIVVFDNKAYFIKTKYQHVETTSSEGPQLRADGEFLHTVNWFHLPIRSSDHVEGPIPDDWRSLESSVDFRDSFSGDFSNFKDECWFHFFDLLGEEDDITGVLNHPDYDPGGAHKIIYNKPVLDVSTAAYPDVMKVLDQIQTDLVDNGPRLKSVFVVGDQQSYDRMLNLIELYPRRYSWIVPLPGEFHFMGHCYFAFNRLWYDDLTGWAAQACGFDKTVKRDTEDMSYFSHYDRFYALLTLSIMVVLRGAFDENTLTNPSVVMTMCSRNKGAMILCQYLYRCGLPLLATRMGLRSNRGGVVDRMWKYMAAVFRCVGKTHYGRLSVLSQHVTDHLDDALKRIWAVYRTLSLRGNIGRNVAWDFGCERFNLECQDFMGACVTKERLLEAISILNGIRHVRNQSLRAFGVQNDGTSEYTGILLSDIEHLVDAIRNELGMTGPSDLDTLVSPCSRGTLFRRAGETGYDTRLPWTIEKALGRDGMAEYVSKTIESMPKSVRLR